MSSQWKNVFHNCKCGAIFSAVNFCPFCGIKVPEGTLLKRAIYNVEVEQKLGIKILPINESPCTND